MFRGLLGSSARGQDDDGEPVMISADDISDYNPANILPQSLETSQKIRSWLRPTAYDTESSEYGRHRASHVPGTGTWVISSEPFQSWLHGTEHGFLWIKGIPGSGKSVLAAHIIEELTSTNPGSPVLFFFFRQIVQANHKPSALLRDWLDQILKFSPQLQQQLVQVMERKKPRDDVPVEDMWNYLQNALAETSGPAFCVVDALDEMDQDEDQDRFLRSLGELGRWKPDKVKVLVTSRPVPAIERTLRTISGLKISLREQLVDVDISKYVQSSLETSLISEDKRKLITDAVPSRSNGLFLYAKLAMDEFLKPGADVEIVLSQIPADLNSLYTNLLQEHAQRQGIDPIIQRLILQSATHATRPLRLLELAEIVRTHESTNQGERFNIKVAKNLVRSACGPLLEILPDETVSVVHHSFTEYLKGTSRSEQTLGYQILDHGQTHTELALQCLRYLQSGCLNDIKYQASSPLFLIIEDPDPSPEEVQLRFKFPLMHYAVRSYSHHVAEAEAAGADQTEINKQLDQLLGNEKAREAYLQLRWPGRYQGFMSLHAAAQQGHLSYTKQVLGRIEVDVLDANGRTPLWWAAFHGHTAVVQELISAGANPDHDDPSSALKPLHQAAIKNYHQVVKVLLEAGVDPLTPKTRDPGRRCGNARSTRGETPLMYACHNGHVESIGVFLAFVKDPDTLAKALCWASERGRAEVVRTLVRQPGVDVNASIGRHTALHGACSALDVATVQVLLQAGADPSLPGPSPRPKALPPGVKMTRVMLAPGVNLSKENALEALCAAAEGSGREVKKQGAVSFIFRLLVDAGADPHYQMSGVPHVVNHSTKSGQTFLHCCADSPVLVNLFLEAGLDANATDESGSAPLHSVGSLDSMVLLIEKGHAAIDVARDDGRTPLLLMIIHAKFDLLHKFLEYNPDCTAADHDGSGVLHYIARHTQPDFELLRTFLDRGADPNLVNKQGLTPLMELGRRNHDISEYLGPFLEAGADFNLRDPNGASFLFHQVLNQRFKLDETSQEHLRALVSHGASVDTRGLNSQTLLHEAVKSGKLLSSDATSQLDFWIGLGLDPKAIDANGNNLLHELARWCTVNSSPVVLNLWRALLDLGLSLDKGNSEGQIPLHLLAAPTSQQFFQSYSDISLDFVISGTVDIDAVDCKGVTALHIAATHKHALAKKLLDAGANPRAATTSGMTPLHYAVEAGEANAVGVILDALRSHRRTLPNPDSKGQTDLDESHVPGVDARACDQHESSDQDHSISIDWETGEPRLHTPLYFACKYGRPEIASMLLKAGADAKSIDVLVACHLFKVPRDQSLGRRPMRAGVVSEDLNRLDEIIDVMIRYGADFSRLKSELREDQLTRLAGRDHPYITACINDAKRRRDSELSNSTNASMDPATLQGLESYLETVTFHGQRNSAKFETGKRNIQIFLDSLARREYGVVENLANLGATFLPVAGDDSVSNLGVLVENGFVALVDRIGTQQAKLALKEGNWHAFGDNTRPGLWYAKRDTRQVQHSGANHPPFLLTAIRRNEPNIDMVQLLVEKFGVDINEQQWLCERLPGLPKEAVNPMPYGSALHHAAEGKSWWHVHQAIPYLLKAGAEIETQDGKGMTPLHRALNSRNPFAADAVEVLLRAAGADVNAPIQTKKHLIRHGATVTGVASFAAIQNKDPQLLRVLLSSGVSPDDGPDCSEDVRRRQTQSWLFNHEDEIAAGKNIPLYYVGKWLVHDSKELVVAMELVETLLEYGANPFGTFFLENQDEMGAPDTTSKTLVQVPTGQRECTVAHQLLFDGKRIDPILRLPSLDVNHRDAQGRTLFHAACFSWLGLDYIPGSEAQGSSSATMFQRLLAMGADVEARDHCDRHALHFLMTKSHRIPAQIMNFSERLAQFKSTMERNQSDHKFDKYKASLSELLRMAPSLIDQADVNGNTPLHYAAASATKTSDIRPFEALLDAGANPFATNAHGDNVLHILVKKLAKSKLRDLSQKLVQRGVDINLRNADGETPVFGLIRSNLQRRSLLEQARSFCRNPSEIALWTASGANLAQFLSDLGVDFSATNNIGQGLLHVAAPGQVEVFEALMAKGLDPLMEDLSQQTALDIAAASGNGAVLALFQNETDL